MTSKSADSIGLESPSALASLGRDSRRRTHTLLRLAQRKPLGALGALVLAVLIVAGTLAPVIAPYGPNQSTNQFFQPPSVHFPFGTDELGRDMLSRVIAGARISLEVSIFAVGLGTGLGTLVGLVSGYFKGWADHVIQRIVDVLIALPGLLILLLIVASFGASLQNVILAIAVSIVPGTSRVVRSSVLSVREQPYVEAAASLGAWSGRIILLHVLPNVIAPVIVIASIQFGAAILAEASLSYLGLGVPITVPSWGSMLSGSALDYMMRAPWMALFPGLALTIVVLGVNLFGDALRDTLDPRIRRGAR